MKNIKSIIRAEKINMGGLLIDQALPSRQVEQVDPFLLLHHAVLKFPGGEKEENKGVPPHPHRGFSPVSFIVEGTLTHRDSMGNQAQVGPGGFQWMNADHGVVHSERPSKDLAENGGTLEFIQLWVNTPAKHKMDQPTYFNLDGKDVPKLTLDGGKVILGIASGEIQGVKGPVSSHSPVTLASIKIQPGGKTILPLPKDFNGAIYQIKGNAIVNDTPLKKKHLAWLDGEKVEIASTEESLLLLMIGEPLNEEVVSHGPFVLNSIPQINQAITDYQMGKMGDLVEEFE